MPVEMLTYAGLGARLKISPGAARSLVKRRRLPRSLSHDGKALVSVDLAEIKHTRRPPGAREAGTTLLKAEVGTLQAEIAELEARAAGHRADFERERERADRLMVELLQAAAETLDHHNDGDRDSGRDQAVFDRGRAGLVAKEGFEQAHLVSPDLNPVLGAAPRVPLLAGRFEDHVSAIT